MFLHDLDSRFIFHGSQGISQPGRGQATWKQGAEHQEYGFMCVHAGATALFDAGEGLRVQVKGRTALPIHVQAGRRMTVTRTVNVCAAVSESMLQCIAGERALGRLHETNQ